MSNKQFAFKSGNQRLNFKKTARQVNLTNLFKLLFAVCLCFTGVGYAQTTCPKDHPLFQFMEGARPQEITERSFGRGPQFRFLRGITNRNEFVRELKNPRNWRDYKPDSVELESLLRAIGFADGLRDKSLTAERFQYTRIPYGAIGNLGGKNKEREIEYRYATMQVNEKGGGIRAWKITSPANCFFYFFTRCGNAFYPKDTTCPDTCFNVTVKPRVDTVTIIPTIEKRSKKLTICLYKVCVEQTLVKQTGKGGGNGARRLSPPVPEFCIDTILYENTPTVGSYKVWMDVTEAAKRICKDETIDLESRLRIDSIPIDFSASQPDTIKIYRNVYDCPCTQKWELGVDAGFAFTTVPTLPDTVNARRAGARFTANAYIGYNFTPYFQAGLSVSTLTLAYRDNLPYNRPPGANSFYNEVFVAKPVIPIQVFGKVMFGSIRWRTSVMLSAGYAIATNSQIENNGVQLAANPNTTGGFAGMLGFGIDYFLRLCKWAVGFRAKASYFSINGETRNYNLFAFPATIGLRYMW